MVRAAFIPKAMNPQERPYERLRWSRFKTKKKGAGRHRDVRGWWAEARVPLLRTLRDGSLLPSNGRTRVSPDSHCRPPGQGGRAPGMRADGGCDTRGDIYEYMLGKWATRRHQRQFPHTAPHSSSLMVAMTEPKPTDVIGRFRPAAPLPAFRWRVANTLRRAPPGAIQRHPAARGTSTMACSHGLISTARAAHRLDETCSCNGWRTRCEAIGDSLS